MNLTQDDIQFLLDTTTNASAAILKVYAQDFDVDFKEDDSPLTEADRRANAVIVEALQARFPNIPIISEETRAIPYEERKDWPQFWLVDPLDGTKEFVKRNGEFTVNIGLIENGSPVFGVVARPVTGTIYYGSPEESFKVDNDGTAQPLKRTLNYREANPVRVVASRSHMSDEVTAFVNQLKSEGKEVEFISSGSSLKLCLIAEGAAHVYPRLGPTMEWDTGAAHAVALGAGASVLRHDTGKPLVYNKENLLNPWFIVE